MIYVCVGNTPNQTEPKLWNGGFRKAGSWQGRQKYV